MEIALKQPRTLSLRQAATGEITDFLADEGLDCAHTVKLLAYFTGALINYKEEGVQIAPDILLCESIGAALASLPNSRHVEVGSAECAVESAKVILKNCATLSENQWNIYIERRDDGFVNYGVAYFPFIPGSLTFYDGVMLREDCLSIMISKKSESIVEICGSKGSIFTCHFSTSREENSNDDGVKYFTKSCVSSIENEEFKDDFYKYMEYTIFSLLRSSHGCILACVESDKIEAEEFSDRVDISPPIDFYQTFTSFKSGDGSKDLAELQGMFGLAQGFFRSDGVVFFNTLGQIIAFRAFYRPQAAGATDGQSIVGGARRRAYEGAKHLVGKSLIGLLFRSQDGLTLYEGAK